MSGAEIEAGKVQVADLICGIQRAIFVQITGLGRMVGYTQWLAVAGLNK